MLRIYQITAVCTKSEQELVIRESPSGCLLILPDPGLDCSNLQIKETQKEDNFLLALTWQARKRFYITKQ